MHYVGEGIGGSHAATGVESGTRSLPRAERDPGLSVPGVLEKWACRWRAVYGYTLWNFSDNPPHPTPRPQSTHSYSGAFTLLSLPGCELSGHTRSFTFKVEEEDDAEHVLALTMVRGLEGWGW